jgi:hypothetical protein
MEKIEVKQYIGVKIIKASEPITKKQYCEYRGWIVPADEDKGELVRLVEYAPDPKSKPNHENHEGYVSMSPVHVFNEAYKETTGLPFGLAIEAMKRGRKVARKGWNGKSMWIAVGGQPVDLKAEGFWNPHAKQHAIDNGGSATVLPYIIFKTATNEILMGWLASQTDMLAEDWMVVE